MKKLAAILLVIIFVACNNKGTKAPDVSDIKVTVPVERFDRDFFNIDTNSVSSGLDALFAKYPVLGPIFLQNILGLDSSNALQGVAYFIRLTRNVYEDANKTFSNTNDLQQQFETAFKYVKYYFPNYPVPKLITVVGPLDALARNRNSYTPDFLGPDFLGISLQFYLGKDYPAYNDPYFVENIAPAYRSRRFSKEYIIADGMQLIVDDLYPDQSAGKPLVEQMVEKGKQWWLLDKFLPNVPDSVKTGYTQAQLDWCLENEGLIWNYITRNERLDAIDPATLQTYIGEGPFTQGFSQEFSPGNLGQWLGWRIVQKFEENNTSLKPAEIMVSSARKIIDEAKYKPK